MCSTLPILCPDSATGRDLSAGRGRCDPLLPGTRVLTPPLAVTSQQDVGDVIARLAATQWADRKDGLLALQSVLRSNRMLTASELKRITEIFTKMFMDTHTKVGRLGHSSSFRDLGRPDEVADIRAQDGI